jgi:hypothetical protein
MAKPDPPGHLSTEVGPMATYGRPLSSDLGDTIIVHLRTFRNGIEQATRLAPFVKPGRYWTWLPTVRASGKPKYPLLKPSPKPANPHVEWNGAGSASYVDVDLNPDQLRSTGTANRTSQNVTGGSYVYELPAHECRTLVARRHGHPTIDTRGRCGADRAAQPLR